MSPRYDNRSLVGRRGAENERYALLYHAICKPNSEITPADMLRRGLSIFANPYYTNCIGGYTTGFFVYPGPGKGGTEIDFFGGNAGVSPLIFYHFPLVPTEGLSAWSPESPVSALSKQLEVEVTGYSEPETIGFVLNQATANNWFINLTITSSKRGCQGSISLDSYKTGPAP